MNNRFIFAAVKGNYGDKLITSLDYIILIEVPKQIRNRRVHDRSYQKFGDRILPGGDLFDQESKWFSLTDSRPETYVTDWLETIDCPVIRVDGTLPVEENVDYILSASCNSVFYPVKQKKGVFPYRKRIFHSFRAVWSSEKLPGSLS